MPLPDYQQCMLPLLTALADGQVRPLKSLTQIIAVHFSLTDGERAELLPSGQGTVIANRVAWAKTYLKKAGLLVQPTRGMAQITEAGAALLKQAPNVIDNDVLRRYASFTDFVDGSSAIEAGHSSPQAMHSVATPEELIEESHTTLQKALADEVLERVKACSPRFFERLVVDLLVKMGYGGSLADAGQAVGGTGDGGIDGVIKEDKLGLDTVCLQAKRWERTVGRPEVQAFAGSMEGHRARKGVLLTTSSFSKEAEDYISRIERKIVLIGGRRLAELMIEHDVGVAVAQTYVLKRLDSDYFETEDV